MDDFNKIKEHLKQILELSNSKRVNTNLRIVLLDYLILHDDYPTNLKEILIDFNIMFDLLNLLSKLDATNSEVLSH